MPAIWKKCISGNLVTFGATIAAFRMNVFIVEDEDLYIDQLEMVVEQAGHSVCGAATNAEEALRLFEKSRADMALIDINLAGEMDGLELGKWLKRFRDDILIIFITAHYADVEYFEKAKQLSAYAFLKKPIDATDLLRTIALAFQYNTTQADIGTRTYLDDHHMLLVKIKAKYIKVDQNDITHIAAEDKYCSIHLKDGTVYLERISLKELNKKLSPRLFAQTHRSYIVNLNNVQETDIAEYTIMVNGHQVPLGDTYKDYFLKKFGA